MNEKPEDWALLVADQLDATASRLVPGGWNREGAKELRRQHAEIKRLRAASEKLFRKWSNAAPYHQWEPEMFEMELALCPPKQENKK